MIKNQKNRINEVVSNSIQNLTDIIDVNTVIGEPVKIDNEVIIPISKVTFCVLAGGGEYGKVNIFKGGDNLPYSAGNGSLISLKPCGFLIKNKSEEYKILSVSNNNFDELFDKATDLIKDITNKCINNNENNNE